MKDRDDDNIEQVVDEEGTVDKKIKSRILRSRDAINENESVLFTEPVVSPDVRVSHAQSTVAWGHTVKRFIRDIEILLRSEEIDNAEYYYKEVDLGGITLVPPDKDGYQFSLFCSDEFDNQTLKRQMNLPPDFEPPTAEPVEFNGLRDLLESQDIVSHSWTFYVDKTGPKDTWDMVTATAEQPVPKRIYGRAVREADQFLQQAGIGLDISPESVPAYGFEEVHENEPTD